jgi:chemotaxis protein CheX
MRDAQVELKSYRTEDFLSSENLRRADDTVTEIFRVMFNFDIEATESSVPDAPMSPADGRTAIVGFSGSMRGSCHVRVSDAGARLIASAMLGGMPVEEDDCINDALGELCNMLAGGWKNGISSLSSWCSLSPPTIVSGHDYKIRTSKPSLTVTRCYLFETHKLQLVLSREETAI